MHRSRRINAPGSTFRLSGTFTTEFTGEATGSGIGTLITGANQQPGDVSLIAPGGRVDAGDAGIRVSGNLVIAE